MRGGVCDCRYCTERVQITCAFCKKIVWGLRRKKERRGQRFCSRRCANRWNARSRAGRPPCECGCGMLIGPQATRFISGHNPPTPRAPLRGPANGRWSGGRPKNLICRQNTACGEKPCSRRMTTRARAAALEAGLGIRSTCTRITLGASQTNLLRPSTSTTVKHFVSIVIARFTGVWTERDGAGGSAPVRNRLRHIEPVHRAMTA